MMGDLLQFKPKTETATAIPLLEVDDQELARLVAAGTFIPPDADCTVCGGCGWSPRESASGDAVPSVIICDCMKE